MRTKACSHCGTFNAIGAKDCKDCGEPFKVATTPEQQSSMCAWSETGQRCYEPGTFSESMQGGGPWYCRRHEHMRLGRADPGYKSVETPEQRYERRMRGYAPVPKEGVRGAVLAFIRKGPTKWPSP